MSGKRSLTRPRQNRSRELYDSILEAALQCLDSVGPEQSSTNRIAKRAGVSIGSLYRYFPDKHVLFRAAVDKFLDDNRNLFVLEVQSRQGKDLERVIQEVIVLSIDHFSRRRRLFVVLNAYMNSLGVSETIFKGRAALAGSLAKALIHSYPDKVFPENENLLIAQLELGFHAYMASLSFILAQSEDEILLPLLAKNMSSLFVEIILSHNS